MSHFNQFDFNRYHSAMQRVDIPFSASEAHGIAVGLISGAVHERDAAWQAELYAEIEEALSNGDALAHECRDLLDALYAVTAEQMQDDSFDLQLLLPNEDTVEYSGTQALADWAQGFLFGVGLAGKHLNHHLSDESREALQDFYAIAQLDVVEGGQLGEEEQQAQTEIEEYLRMSALMIYADMRTGEPRHD